MTAMTKTAPTTDKSPAQTTGHQRGFICGARAELRASMMKKKMMMMSNWGAQEEIHWKAAARRKRRAHRRFASETSPHPQKVEAHAHALTVSIK